MKSNSRQEDDEDEENLQLPDADAPIALAVYRLEAASSAIYQAFRNIIDDDQESPPEVLRLKANAHFRSSAYKLLSHYVEHRQQEAFRWLLEMHGAAPKRARIPLDRNPFHWGLLAMTAAGGRVLSRNRLRDLGVQLQEAHAMRVQVEQLESFIAAYRRLPDEPVLREDAAEVFARNQSRRR